MHKRGWKRIWALALTAIMLASTPALAEYAARVSDSVIPVYADASFSQRIGSIARDAYLTVNATQNGVANITYYGKDGYVAVSGLTTVSAEAQDAVVVANARFYQHASTQSAYTTLAPGTKVRLMAVDGTCAMIEYDGHIGFIMRSDIRTADEETPDAEESGEVVYETFRAMVSRQGARVYQRDSLTSASQPMTYGRTFTVVAYNDTWAQVYNGSSYGFTPRENLTRVEEAGPTATATPAPTSTPTSRPTATPTPSAGPVYRTYVLCYTSLTNKSRR